MVMLVTNVELKNKKKNLQMLIFLYLHTHVYNQISTLHIDKNVHTSMLIHTFVHITSVRNK
jgi:hypothetical protein